MVLNITTAENLELSFGCKNSTKKFARSKYPTGHGEQPRFTHHNKFDNYPLSGVGYVKVKEKRTPTIEEGIKEAEYSTNASYACDVDDQNNDEYYQKFCDFLAANGCLTFEDWFLNKVKPKFLKANFFRAFKVASNYKLSSKILDEYEQRAEVIANGEERFLL